MDSNRAMTQANVVVTCTNRKTRAVPRELHLRASSGASLDERADRWLERLRDAIAAPVPARDLYCGEHWDIVKQLSHAASVWVASAGYGLVPTEAPLKPYAATFAARQPDSITREAWSEDAARRWWGRLAAWKGPAPRPRTLTALARENLRTPLLVVAAPAYVRAMTEDLLGASRLLDDRLTIVTSQAKLDPALRRHVVTSEARLVRVVGGSRIALNARVGLHILENQAKRPLSAPVLREHYVRLAARQEEVIMPERQPMSDNDVRAFIREQVRANPKARHSPLLRVLREQGQACEQGRFRKLFQEVTGVARVS